jgi:hypothetical protein
LAEGAVYWPAAKRQGRDLIGVLQTSRIKRFNADHFSTGTQRRAVALSPRSFARSTFTR